MEHSQLFRGNALSRVDSGGQVRLPGFVRAALSRQEAARQVVLGVHEHAPCLTGYGLGFVPVLHAEIERLRRRDEAAGASADAHWARAHRAFGLAEDADCDDEGRIVLPPLIRRRAGIDSLALFVGVGASFEIWNPDTARETGDRDLRELAEYRLGQSPRTEQGDETR